MIAEVAQIIATVGVVGSILILAWQTRQLALQTRINNTIGMTEAHDNSLQRLHEGLTIIATYPELRAYLYEEKDCPVTDPNCARALATAEIIADAVDYGIRITKKFPDTVDWTGWHDGAKFIFRQPVIRELIIEHYAWWPDLTQYLVSLGHAIGPDYDDQRENG